MGHSCSCNCQGHSEEQHRFPPYILPAVSFIMLLAGLYMQHTDAELFLRMRLISTRLAKAIFSRTTTSSSQSNIPTGV